jgi:hypothetical protein
MDSSMQGEANMLQKQYAVPMMPAFKGRRMQLRQRNRALGPHCDQKPRARGTVLYNSACFRPPV